MERTVENIVLGTSRRILYTPRTPRTRERQRFSLAFDALPVEEDVAFDTLEELLRQTWTVFGVSTLFGFQQGEVYLKQYAKRLREEIASSLSQEDVSYDAKFYVMENVTPRPSPMDPPPIKVEVFAKIIGREGSIEKCIYKGIFLSWRTTINELNTGNSVRLPLLLCRGTRSGMDAVHATLSRMFDCMIIALPAKEDDLTWLVPIIITPTGKEEQPKSTDQIRMEYVIPGLPVTDTIVIKFRVLDLVKILTVINKDHNNDRGTEISFSLEHIEKFHEVLYTQMLETASLQLGLCTLRKINLPTLTIMENRMKVMNSEAMNRILLYLNEKALDTFHTLQFDV